MTDFPRSLFEFQRRFPDEAACVAYLGRITVGRITVTVYSTFHSSCACRAVSCSTRGFGPGLRGAKGRGLR